MSKGVILTVASVCGAAAFFWTLVARSGGREHAVVLAQPSPSSGRRGGHGAMPMSLPRDLQGLEQHVKNSPGDFQAWFDLANRRRAANMPEESAAWAMVVQVATQQTTQQPEWGLAWFQLGWAADRLGDAEHARAALAQAERIYTRRVATSSPPDPGVLTRLGWARRKLGDETGAHAAWQQGDAMLTQGDVRDLDSDSAYNLACFRALLGRTADALEALGIAVQKGYSDADWASIDDDLAPLARDPRFAALVQKMKDVPRPMQWQDGGVATPAR